MSADVPREAEVIRLAREAMDMTALSAAEASRARDGKGISAAYWRDVERGYGGRRGQRVPVRASARALAAMARAVGVEPAQLAGAGREDAARVLEEALRRDASAQLPDGAADTGSGGRPLLALIAGAFEGELARNEAEVWAELSRHPSRTPPAAIFAHPAEAALMGVTSAPLAQRVRWIAEFRFARAHPPRADAPPARRAG
jgi:hypothetical protein